MIKPIRVLRNCVLAIAFSTLGVACGHSPPGALPATPGGEQVRVWLEALNDPDPQVLQRLDPRAGGFRAQFGGFDLVRVEAASETEITALMTDRLVGDYFNVTWVLSDEAPPSIVNIGVRPAAPPEGASRVARIADGELADYLKGFLEQIDYSGTVLVARDGAPVVTLAHGMADRERGVAMAMDTRLRVGSMDKMFTAVAVMQLVQAGKVKLDAPVGDYLTGYPNQEFARTVTVRQLLTHTGGAGDIFGPQFAEKRLELKTLSDYVALYGERAPEFTPGSTWRYANYGFVLLGRIVEEVSGQTYPDYVRDHVFAPAGMTRSGFEPESVDVEGRAVGYMTEADVLVSAADTLPYSGTSAGGGYATVGDFLAFANALTGHRLLDAEHTEMLVTKKVESSGYAFGFGDLSNDEVRMFGHSGGAPGQNGDLLVIGDGQVVIVALSNVSPPGRVSQVMGRVLDRVRVVKADGEIAGGLRPPPPAPAPPPPNEAQRMAAFADNDADSDGRLDKAEYKRLLEVLGFADRLDVYFAQRDADKDGFVTEAEYRTPIQ